MLLRGNFLHRLSLHEVQEMVSHFISGGKCEADKEALYALTLDDEPRVSVNAFGYLRTLTMRTTNGCIVITMT